MFVVQDGMSATIQTTQRSNHVSTTNHTHDDAHAQATYKQLQQQQQQQSQQQQQQSLPLRQKCGVVYTWQCEVFAGVWELYAIECALCADRPLCRLSEFAEHMNIWHTHEWHENFSEAAEAIQFTDIIEENEMCEEENVEELQEGEVESVKENEEQQFTELMADIFDANRADSEEIASTDDDERDADADAHVNGSLNTLAPFEQVLIATDASEEMLNESCGSVGAVLMTENDGDCVKFVERTECTKATIDKEDNQLVKSNCVEGNSPEEINEFQMTNENFENLENSEIPHITNLDNIPIEELLPEDLEQLSHEDITQITDFIEVPDIVDTNTNVTDSGVSSGGETDDLPKKMLDYNKIQSNEIVTDEMNTREIYVEYAQQQSNDMNVNLEQIDIEESTVEGDEAAVEEEEEEAEILKEVEEEMQNNNNQMTIDPTSLNPQQQIDYGLDEPLTHSKLTRDDTIQLIAFYKEHQRLWQQTHTEYHDTQLNRKSWQQITYKWNRYKPQHQLTRTEVRARIALLCQRYMKERERLNTNEESSDMARFLYYKQLQFMDAQQPLQNRRRLCEQQNAKLLEIYEHYPVLWHNAQRFAKQPARRTEALRHISMELKLHDIHLTPYSVRQRLQALRKIYRLERIQQLQHQLDKKTYESTFKHFQTMQFLNRHMDPYVCVICGKIFENFLIYKTHAVGACEKTLDGIEIESEKKAISDVEEIEQKGAVKSTETQLNSDRTMPVENISKTTNEIISSREQHNNTQPSNSVDSTLEMSGEMSLSHKNSNDINEEHVGVKLNNKQVVDENVQKTLPKVSTNRTKTKAIKNIVKNARRKHVKQKTQATNLKTHVEVVSEQSESNETGKNETDVANDLIVKVQCEKLKFSYDLRLNRNELEMKDGEEKEDAIVKKLITTVKTPNSRRLNADQTHKLITLYRQQPQLWNSHHLDHKSRSLRMLAWRNITTKLNKMLKTRFTCTILHRKLTDLLKYYRRERQRIQQDHSCTKWAFYEAFNFLDVVHASHSQLDKSLQQRRQQLQIIALYKAQPQLWNTENVEFRQRRLRQRHVLRLCQRLQHECRIVMKPAHLKQRLTDMRSAYRNEKQRRLLAEQCSDTFNARYEYYDALLFLDAHVAPFLCTDCGTSFKRLSEYTKHMRKTHTNNAEQQAKFVALKHICHICGIKFTLRSNLLFHLKRHLHKGQHVCTLCPKTFHSTTALRVHMRYHTKEYPYMCENCGMSYVNASKLNQHMKRHRNQRDYACGKCSRAFYTAFDLDRHERRHLNIRDKVCPVCGKAFYPGSAYYAHMMLHSDEKRFKCDDCGLRFAQYAGLYKHRKRYHPTET